MIISLFTGKTCDSSRQKGCYHYARKCGFGKAFIIFIDTYQIGFSLFQIVKKRIPTIFVFFKIHDPVTVAIQGGIRAVTRIQTIEDLPEIRYTVIVIVCIQMIADAIPVRVYALCGIVWKSICFIRETITVGIIINKIRKTIHIHILWIIHPICGIVTELDFYGVVESVTVNIFIQ